MNRKLSVETVRFLNHIDRQIKTAVDPYKSKISVLGSKLSIAEDENKKLNHQLSGLQTTFSEMSDDLHEIEIRYKNAIKAISHLLPKIRVDIWSGKTSTPRYFESGKWWSRETGNLDAEFVSEMTDDEKIEAIDFYGTTELPFMAKPSMRDELALFEAAKCLWYRYEALPESERSKMSFPQFCGLARKEHKEAIKKELEYSEKIGSIAE